MKLPDQNVRDFAGAQQNFENLAGSLTASFPVSDANLATKTIRGEVGSAGAVVRGSGFTSVRNAVGNYTVTFTTAFSAPPVVIATPASAAGAHGIEVSSVSTTAFTILTNNRGASLDSPFAFHAMSV